MIFTWDAQFLLLAYMRILDFESPILSKTKYQSSVILFYFIYYYCQINQTSIFELKNIFKNNYFYLSLKKLKLSLPFLLNI